MKDLHEAGGVSVERNLESLHEPLNPTADDLAIWLLCFYNQVLVRTMDEKILPITVEEKTEGIDTTATEKRQNRYTLGHKWRRAILLGAFFCSLSLGANIAGAVVANRSGVGKNGGRRTIFQGNCGHARELNTYIHLGINLLSTILFASSNYAMQCLSAPTRTEVDVAHTKRKWLDIGVLSFRNLTRIDPCRVLVWLLFVMSSLPLHLV
jgi:hypothetical protein